MNEWNRKNRKDNDRVSNDSSITSSASGKSHKLYGKNVSSSRRNPFFGPTAGRWVNIETVADDNCALTPFPLVLGCKRVILSSENFQFHSCDVVVSRNFPEYIVFSLFFFARFRFLCNDQNKHKNYTYKTTAQTVFIKTANDY